MGQHGITLVEMVVVICIVAILTAIGTVGFNDYFKRTASRNQARMIYTELLNVRGAALNEGRSKAVKVKATSFEVYSSAADDDGAQPQKKISLTHPITCSKSLPVSLTFDTTGVANLKCSICTADDSTSSGADSIIVTETRLRIGKRSPGKECLSENIAVQ